MVATLQFGAGGQARPMASGKRRWSASEDEALGQWVAGCGARWTALEVDGLLPARTARAMESRWKELRRKGGTAGLTQDGGGSGVSQSLPSQGLPRPAGMADSTEGWVAEGWGQAAPAAAGTVRGPRMGVLRFEEDAATATGNARRRAHGRAWTGALKALGPAAREAAPHEKKKAAAWGIDGVGPARATVFPRAVQMLRRGAGVSKVSVGSRGKLSTLMATRTRVPYVSGGVAGGGRPMQAKEAAALLGISLRSEAWREAASGLSEEELWRATADSVDAHHVRAMWRNAAEMAEARGRTLEGRELRYAGMFAGALDAIFTGGRAQGWPLRYVAVAEENRLRRGCLSKAYLIPKARRYVTASKMAAGLATRLDVLSATPSCRLLSSARRAGGGKGGASKGKAEQRLRRRAQAKLLADVAAVREVAERCEPMVIMIEETAGLRHSRHAALYRSVQAELRGWPYDWRHVESDCAELGAAHHRKRLLWVGVRRRARAAV